MSNGSSRGAVFTVAGGGQACFTNAGARSRKPDAQLGGRGFKELPTKQRLMEVAAMVPHAPKWDGREGPVWRVTASYGMIQVGTKDYAKLNLSREQREERRIRDNWGMTVTDEKAPPKRGEITKWSAKSRNNMARTIQAVNFGPLVDQVQDGLAPAMVTLTLPGDWLTVAPTGEAFKKLVNQFRDRYRYAWHVPIAGVWKLEFQHRGAPHLHILTVPPAGNDPKWDLPFREWLSRTWADVVNHPDPVERANHELAGTGVDYESTLRYGDPKRIATYFSKHGLFADKEYQNVVPEAWQDRPGRFWGVWVLDVDKANIEIPDNQHYVNK